MSHPTELKYTKEHEWVKVEGELAYVGITDYAQSSLGDIVFVDVPEAGTEIEAGQSFATIESVKAVSEIFAPISGTIAEINGELATAPEKVNADAHAAWLVKVKIKDPAQLAGLLSAADYEKFIAEEKH